MAKCIDTLIADVEALISHAKIACEIDPPTKIEDLARHYSQLRALADTLKKVTTPINKTIQYFTYTIVPDALREAGIKTVTVEGVGRISMTTRVSCSMLNKDDGMNWLTENGYADLIQPTVNASTLGAFAKGKMEEGFDLPEDLFNTSVTTGTSLTKAK